MSVKVNSDVEYPLPQISKETITQHLTNAPHHQPLRQNIDLIHIPYMVGVTHPTTFDLRI